MIWGRSYGLNEEYYHIEVFNVVIDDMPNAASLCTKTLKVMMFQPEPLEISLCIYLYSPVVLFMFAPDGMEQ